MRGHCSIRAQRVCKTEAEQHPLGGVFRLQSSTSEGQAEGDEKLEAAVIRKIYTRLLWKLTLMAILCYIDRTSLAFAAPELINDLGFTSSQFGLGAGIFFVGYIIFQVR